MTFAQITSRKKDRIFAIFFSVSFFYITVIFLLNLFVYTDSFYFNAFGNQLTSERIESLITQQKRLAWINYLAIPIVIFFKILLPATCIFIYSMLYDFQFKWKIILKITIEAEVIFLIPLVVKLVWFFFFPPDNMEAISDFSPWSLLFLAHDDSHRYIKYVLQAINAFEVLYWITLAVGIKSTLRISFKDGLVIVGKSYGLGLLMWIVLICFFLIQIS